MRAVLITLAAPRGALMRLALVVTLVAGSALGQIWTVGDLVVVKDPGGAITGLLTPGAAIIPSPQEQFCRAAYNTARNLLPDDYDGVFTFSTYEGWSDLSNVWMGPPVRADATGIGRADAPWIASYNSTRLGQCVFMGTLGHTAGFVPGTVGAEALPPDPDADWSPSIGIPIPGFSSLTGIEMLGHEYGHHWLLGLDFDLADGRGRQSYIRATTGQNPESGDPGHPNQHYSDLADSRSVMYGECITPLDGGSYLFQGCPRKYSHVDQYLMGLRGPGEVSPMLVLEDLAAPGQGTDSLGMSRTASRTQGNLLPHEVGAADIIRAMGPRVPAYPSTQRCWRVAFIVVLGPGETSVPAAMLQKVQRYQQRWTPWFDYATDGRGAMETRLGNYPCPNPEVDAGVDAGVDLDGGADAGLEADGGEADAGADGGQGEELDGGAEPVDAGDQCLSCGYIKKIRPGCGCGQASGFELLGALGLALALALVRGRGTGARRRLC